MPHHIETHHDQAAAIFARTDPWHRLGVTVRDRAFTAEEAMTLGHLGGWNVRKAPLTATVLENDGVTTLDAPGFATIRDNPFTGRPEALGVVGAGYQPLQNEDHAEFLNHLADQSGAIFDTAGCCSPRSGWSAPTPRPPPYAATRPASLPGTRHAKAAVAAARDALGLTFAYSQKFQAEAAVEPLELLASEREVNRQHHARRPGGRLSWRAPDLVDVAVRQQRHIESWPPHRRCRRTTNRETTWPSRPPSTGPCLGGV